MKLDTTPLNQWNSLLAVPAIVLLAFASQSAFAGPVFGSASYTADKTFQSGPSGGPTTTGLAWDGSNYYAAYGGFSSSPINKYDAAGNLLASTSPTPGIDFRSVFTNVANEVFARGYSSNTIYRQTSFGNFTSVATLTGGSLDAQSQVVLNGSGTEYIARLDDLVSRWDLSGNFLGSITLSGLSGTEINFPQDRGIAAFGSYILTFDNQTLSAWDLSGNRVDSTTLTASGGSVDSYFSYSYAADGRFWVVDGFNGTWRGYQLAGNFNNVPEPATIALIGLGLGGLAFGKRRKPA